MKILVILLTIACLQVSAHGSAQGISLSVKNTKLEKVFSLIESQSGFRFIYSQEVIEKTTPVTLSVRNETLKNLLRLCFEKQPVAYVLNGVYVIIRAMPFKFSSLTSVGEQSVPERSEIDVTGRILNEKGEKAAGITITVKGTNRITVSDNEGNFSLLQIDPAAVLVISGAEVETIETPVKNQHYLVITVVSIVGVLDETVVKGYYNSTVSKNTGSVSKLSAKDIRIQSISNPLAALQGRVSGVLVSQSNGLPGSTFSVLIRGRNSITSGNSPLFIINGVPFLNDQEILTQRGGSVHNNPFNTINPLDIESIEILKDADATAIYGSKGANGVILITTKKSKAGKTTVEASSRYGWAKTGPTVPFMNTQQYLTMRREAFKNDNITPTAANAKDLFAYDTNAYTDLTKLLIGHTAHTSNTNIRIGGGSENTLLTAGVGYYTESSVFYKGGSLRRISTDLAAFHKTADNKFSLAINASFASNNSQLIPGEMVSFINLAPNLPELYDSLGRLNWKRGTASFNNPIGGYLRKYDVLTDRVTVNTTFSYCIAPELSLKLPVGYNRIDVDEKGISPIASYDPAFAPTGSALFGKSSSRTWNVEPQLEYTLRLKSRHQFQFLAGTTWRETKTAKNLISAAGYTNDNLLNSTTGASSITATNSFVQYRYTSVFGRINYQYRDKYLVNITGRRDGSSRFGPGLRFANFGAVGVGWIFTKEKFSRQWPKWFNYGKLRGSYGITGNDLINDYQYLDSYVGTTYTYQGSVGLRPSRLFNPDYSWEQINKTEVALELGFFKNKLLINTNLFNSRSDNQIVNYQLPGQTGFTGILKNFPGVVRNRGIELEITSVNFSSPKFTWSSSFNFTIARNKLISFPGLATSSYASQYLIGRPLNLNIGYHFLGVDSLTGIYKFEDTNKDNVISTADYHYLGTTEPVYYGGLNNSISWKGVELDFLFEFRKQLGRHLIYASSSAVGSLLNQPVAVLDRWTKPGDNKPYQRYTQTFGAVQTAAANASRSDAALTDASYVRLKAISVAYNLPKEILRRIKMDKLQFYLQAQNLFIIKTYMGNPDAQTVNSLPPTKVVTIGIQLNF